MTPKHLAKAMLVSNTVDQQNRCLEDINAFATEILNTLGEDEPPPKDAAEVAWRFSRACAKVKVLMALAEKKGGGIPW